MLAKLHFLQHGVTEFTRDMERTHDLRNRML